MAALVVDVRRWVRVGKPQRRWQARAHHLAARLGNVGDVGPVAKDRGLRRHAALPGAVILDGSIALPDNERSSVQAAGAGRGCRGDQPSGHQYRSESSDDVVLPGSLLRIVAGAAEYWCRNGKRLAAPPPVIKAVVPDLYAAIGKHYRTTELRTFPRYRLLPECGSRGRSPLRPVVALQNGTAGVAAAVP